MIYVITILWEQRYTFNVSLEKTIDSDRISVQHRLHAKYAVKA